MYSFHNLEPVCSMSGSNCCFLTCIQISQEAGKVVWYSHLFKNFSHFVVIHTVEICMQVKKQQVEPDMEQTGSKLGKEYIKAVYCHPAYLTYI